MIESSAAERRGTGNSDEHGSGVLDVSLERLQPLRADRAVHHAVIAAQSHVQERRLADRLRFWCAIQRWRALRALARAQSSLGVRRDSRVASCETSDKREQAMSRYRSSDRQRERTFVGAFVGHQARLGGANSQDARLTSQQSALTTHDEQRKREPVAG